MIDDEGQAELRYCDGKGNLISKIDASAPLVMDWQRGSVPLGDMSRLLHAAARGARIEALYQRCWIPCNTLTVPNRHTYRIHPDDEHLQYGPISTALRKNAESFDADHTAGLPYVEGYFIFTNAEADCLDADELHRSLFLLILAEALAEEGL